MEEGEGEGGSPAEHPGYFCGFPGYAAPQDKVRLQKIAGTKLADTATCTEGALYFHRKRADCARHFMGGEKGKPGRPAKVQAGPSRIPAGAVVHSGPCPAFLEVIHATPRGLGHSVRIPPTIPDPMLTARAAHRYCNIADMTPEQR